MADEEQVAPATQDPVPTVPEPPAPPAPSHPGPGPWQQDLQQTFTDPQIAAQVDSFLRSHVQPRVTKLEQQYAETQAARELLDAYNADPDAANVAVNRQLYGDEYANQLAASFGRNDLVEGAVNSQPPAQQTPTAEAPQVDPRYEEMYNSWAEQRAQEQYDTAKTEFLKDPQYADITNQMLFDRCVATSETWEEAVNSYRHDVADIVQERVPAPPQEMPPPTLGSNASGAPGSTPTTPQGESIDEAIDNWWREQAPPPVG